VGTVRQRPPESVLESSDSHSVGPPSLLAGMALCFKHPICTLGCMPSVFRAFTGSYCAPKLIAMPTKGKFKIMQ
jgi:hypothetical protein